MVISCPQSNTLYADLIMNLSWCCPHGSDMIDIFNTSLPASIYNLDTRLLMNHQSLCLAVFLKPGKAIFSLITQHNNTNQIQPSLHPAETDNTEII